jgi:hypothetical protein
MTGCRTRARCAAEGISIGFSDGKVAALLAEISRLPPQRAAGSTSTQLRHKMAASYDKNKLSDKDE